MVTKRMVTEGMVTKRMVTKRMVTKGRNGCGVLAFEMNFCGGPSRL